MLDNFIYEDHLGRRFDGLKNKVYLNYSELRNYSWSYETINNRISRFYRPIKDRKLPLWVQCNSEEEAVAVKNRLYELTETDVEANHPGKVYIGEYYTNGYITSSVKNDYLIHNKMCKIDLVLTSDDMAWYKEQKYAFVSASGNAIGVGGGTDYPYDYSYDYALSMKGRTIVCGSVGSNAFRLLIYGAIENPAVVINGHTYAINGAIGEGETLLIDSLTKTITLTAATGNKVNWFDKRNRDNYIFEPIPAGQSTISWVGSFGVDLTVIEKRSEPKWT